MNENSIRKLELKAVLSLAAEYTQSMQAKNALKNFIPENDIERVRFLLTQTAEAVRLMDHYNVYPGFNFDTVTEAADKAKILSTLSLRELLCVKRMLMTARSVSVAMRTVTDESIIYLPQLSQELYYNKTIEEELDFAIISEEELHDRASDELYRIRTAIRKTNDEIKIKLASYVHSSEMSKYMQDAIVTMRGGRYVIPVKAEYKSAVNGIVHDQSGSGATYFIEPMAIVNLNNKIRELMTEERDEIERILKDFTKRISVFAAELIHNEAVLVELDTVFAKAKYANETKCTMPSVNDKGIVDLKSARHPLIAKSKVVPVSIRLGESCRILLITGPNTGGKTVSLKTVGLFSLMAGCGMLLPCFDDSKISVYENIFCDIGDEQSIEQNLSTFSGHIKNISNILKSINGKTLVLIDEVGAGTEPNEGAALALAITEHILKSGSFAIITTHYSALKEYSLVTEGIENASMEFNTQTFEPTYKLVMGVPGSSNAIEIAKRLGLDKSVIASARGKISGEKISFENVLRQAETLRQQYEAAKAEADELRNQLQTEVNKAKSRNEMLAQEREKLLHNSKTEAKKIISNAQQEAQELIEEIKNIKKKAAFSDDESELFKARAISRQISDLKFGVGKDLEDEADDFLYSESDKVNINKLQAGHSVYVRKLGSKAIVQSVDIKTGKVTVRIGKISSIVKADELYYCVDVKPAKKQVNTSSKTQIHNRAVQSEINLLGKNVDEAIMEVDPFIDLAFRSGLHELRIIHGMGTGALRAGLHKYFRTDKRIKEFRLGRYGEGESGVTIVTLKND